jgi:hypothetical protein
MPTLADMYDGFVFELEGLADPAAGLIPFARETLGFLHSIAFLTTDPALTDADVVARLISLGINAHPEQVITSARARERQLTGLVPHARGTRPDPYPSLLRAAVRQVGGRYPLVVSHSLACVAATKLLYLPSTLVLDPASDLRSLLLCPPSQRPTFVLTDLRDMFRSQPIVDCDARYWECEGWIATVSHGCLRLYPGPPATLGAGARVLCAAAWNWRGPELDVEPALSLFTSLVG